MRWFRPVLFVPPVLIGIGMVWNAMTSQSHPPVVIRQELAIPVSYVIAKPRAFTPQIEGYGTVAPEQVWTAIAQVSGTIEYVHPAFARGGFVGAGEVLVHIASEEAELALESAEADLKSAAARLHEMRISQQTNTAALAIERKSLDLARSELTRMQLLAKRGVVSESSLHTAERDALAQETKVQSLESTLALLPAQLSAQEQSVAKSEVALRAAALDLDYTEISAPFDARVASAEVELHQHVAAGTTVGALDSASTAEIDAQFSQDRIAGLNRLSSLFYGRRNDDAVPNAAAFDMGCRQDQTSPMPCGSLRGDPRLLKATVKSTTHRFATWPAEVVRISDAVNAETRSLGIIVRVDAPYTRSEDAHRPPLIKGMFVKVRLFAPKVSDAILLPRTAILNGRVMLASPDDRLTFAPVRPIFAFGDMVVLAPTSLPRYARIVTSRPTPAIEGTLLSTQLDVAAEARIAAAAAGGDL